MAEGLSHRTFRLQPRSGDLIRGDVRTPASGPDGRPEAAVVVVHGFKGFKDWAFFPWVAERLAAAGFAAVSFNFSRNGVGEDLGTFGELDRFARNTFSLEREEVALVLEAASTGTLLGYRPRRIGLLGHSRGGAQAILAAATIPEVASLVTWASVATFDRWSEDEKRAWRADGRHWVENQRTGQRMPLDLTLIEDLEHNRGSLDVVAAARRVRVPWLVVHGAADATVDPSDGRVLQAAGPRARLHVVEGAGHTFEARHPFEQVPPQLSEAVDATLAHFARSLRG